MKLAVFGGTGKVGSHIVDQALSAGNEVTVLARNPSAVTATGAKVVQGSVQDPAKVEETVAGQDAVLVALGARKDSPPEVLTEGVRNIVDAMKKTGVNRIVLLSIGGVNAPGDHKNLTTTLTGDLVKLFTGHDVDQKTEQLRIVRESGLEWVAVRPPRLFDGGSEPAHTTAGTDVQLSFQDKISHADLAKFMLDQATNPTFANQAPFVKRHA